MGSAMPDPPLPPRIPSGRLLAVWLALGIQSFGGGAVTLTLLHRAVVERHGWVSDEEFTRDWALSQVAPGINLVALTILLGRRLAGGRGIVLCLVGLLLPSAVITAGLTAGYASIRESDIVRAMLRSVLPAAVGLGLLTAWNMALPPMREARREGMGLFSLLLLTGSGVAVAVYRVPVVVALLASAGMSAALYAVRAARRQRELREDGG